MILEVADISIAADQQAAFESAVRHGIETVISKADGFLGYEIRKSIESPDRYLLLLRWATLEDHTIGFRGGPLFTQWRAIVGAYFVPPPRVEHFAPVAGSA